MNPKHDQPTDISQSDADFLSHLTHFANSIEPEPTFKAHLEAELLQARQSALKGVSPMKLAFRRLNSRVSLVACASVAIAAVFIVPPITSGRLPEWFAALLNSTTDTQANAQTIAHLMETGQVTVTSDSQEYNESTGEVRAIGNATFAHPEAQIQASADEIWYFPTARQIVLSGNVLVLQRGEHLQGTRAICSIEQKQCNLSQK